MAQPRNNEKAVNDIMAVQLRKVPQVFVSECVLYVCMCTMCACVPCVRVYNVVCMCVCTMLCVCACALGGGGGGYLYNGCAHNLIYKCF